MIVIMIIQTDTQIVTLVTCFEPWFYERDSLSPGRQGGGKLGSSFQSGPALSITILSHPLQLINQSKTSYSMASGMTILSHSSFTNNQ